MTSDFFDSLSFLLLISLLTCHAGAFVQLIVGKDKTVFVDGEIKTECFVDGHQCLAKSQALLHHIAVHLLRPGSHQRNHFHDWSLIILPILCGAVDSLVALLQLREGVSNMELKRGHEGEGGREGKEMEGERRVKKPKD